MVVIRGETVDDFRAIREINLAAYGTSYETERIDRLRSDGAIVASLIAVANERIVGHTLFSSLTVRGEAVKSPVASLASVAVLPEEQRRGVGSELVRKGLEVCRSAGLVAVFVLGDPGYYARFGFSSELARKFTSPENVGVGGAFMAIEIRTGALGNIRGTIEYPARYWPSSIV